MQETQKTEELIKSFNISDEEKFKLRVRLIQHVAARANEAYKKGFNMKQNKMMDLTYDNTYLKLKITKLEAIINDSIWLRFKQWLFK
jgi:hypothetical protein